MQELSELQVQNQCPSCGAARPLGTWKCPSCGQSIAETAGSPNNQSGVVYEFVTDNSKNVNDIAIWCNARSGAGWEFGPSGHRAGPLRRHLPATEALERNQNPTA
jgi:hypothetical protein